MCEGCAFGLPRPRQSSLAGGRDGADPNHVRGPRHRTEKAMPIAGGTRSAGPWACALDRPRSAARHAKGAALHPEGRAPVQTSVSDLRPWIGLEI
jgi:hypothetical protein